MRIFEYEIESLRSNIQISISGAEGRVFNAFMVYLAETLLFLRNQNRRLTLRDHVRFSSATQKLWGSVAPVDLTDRELIRTLSSVAKELVESFPNKILQFQVKNSKSLVRKVEVFLLLLLEFLKESTLC
ncbi:hypothetical protein Nepgr_019432 [Nepenthes gracilis]|uniref:Uncharacterized protein n=1 Tax=Nepenthes gracilis TaxID=150966 RepID=A0AAD3SVA9_NEPGR|nr:hypothetical protein Nepgr_019432 [Nepenthes gracilis]